MSKVIWWVIVLTGMALVGLIVYSALAPQINLRLPPPVAGQPSAPAASAPAASAPAEPQIRYPVERQPDDTPLPALDKSDPALKNALQELVSRKGLFELLQPQEFVRHVVATVDNIPRKKIAQRLMPNKPAAGKFAVAGKSDSLTIDPGNAARYAPFLRLAAAVDTEKAVALYIRFYPLFQQAYRELGYPKGYFNDRLIEAIDHLLATPEVKGSIRLVRPNVLYQYENPELESLSAGQKALIRTGSENAAVIKAKLRELRSELLRQVRADTRAPQKKD